MKKKECKTDWMKGIYLGLGVICLFVAGMFYSDNQAKQEVLEFHKTHDVRSAAEYRAIETYREPPQSVERIKALGILIFLSTVGIGIMMNGITLVRINEVHESQDKVKQNKKNTKKSSRREK